MTLSPGQGRRSPNQNQCQPSEHPIAVFNQASELRKLGGEGGDEVGDEGLLLGRVEGGEVAARPELPALRLRLQEAERPGDAYLGCPRLCPAPSHRRRGPL